eukprot:6458747-Amphidinium_carterae.1
MREQSSLDRMGMAMSPCQSGCVELLGLSRRRCRRSDIGAFWMAPPPCGMVQHAIYSPLQLMRCLALLSRVHRLQRKTGAQTTTHRQPGK